MYERILVGTDGSKTAAKAVDRAVDVAADTGATLKALIDEADSGHYDLLVMGNKGMTGLSRFFTASVPDRISHHLPCSLLIVKTT